MNTYKSPLKYMFKILHESTQISKQFSDQIMFETELKNKTYIKYFETH